MNNGEMSVEFAQYIVELGQEKGDLMIIDGRTFYRSKNGISEVKPEYFSPDPLVLNTLSGMVDFIKSNSEELPEGAEWTIYVEDHLTVKLLTQLDPKMRRKCYVISKHVPIKISINNFIKMDMFSVMCQSNFIKTNEMEELLSIVGNIKDTQDMTTGDDGVTQKVTVKKGMTLADRVSVKNPHELAPYRTFSDISQPTSPFVLRIQEGPEAALYEADGGAWKGDAIQLIAEYFKSALIGYPTRKINVIA